ncbi:MAG: hypothetical protein QXT73_00860 [Candidatus Methanomethylicaceae archaeon]
MSKHCRYFELMKTAHYCLTELQKQLGVYPFAHTVSLIEEALQQAHRCPLMSLFESRASFHTNCMCECNKDKTGDTLSL